MILSEISLLEDLLSVLSDSKKMFILYIPAIYLFLEELRLLILERKVSDHTHLEAPIHVSFAVVALRSTF